MHSLHDLNYSTLIKNHFAYARDAGNWVFCRRRWVDSSSTESLSKLIHNYDDLCSRFPAYSRGCSQAEFVRIVSAVSAKWRLSTDALFLDRSAVPLRGPAPQQEKPGDGPAGTSDGPTTGISTREPPATAGGKAQPEQPERIISLRDILCHPDPDPPPD